MKSPLPLPSLWAATLALSLLTSTLFATDGTWTRFNTGTTTWGLASNWLDDTIADGIGSTADFSIGQNGVNRTVNIDDSDRTVGIFNLVNQHNTPTSNQSFTFGSTTGNQLIFDNGSSPAQLNITNGAQTPGGTNTFSLDVGLGSSLQIDNARTVEANTLTFSGGISGVSSGTHTISNISTGPAPVVISGNIIDGSGTVGIHQNSATSWMELSGTNTFTGGLLIEAGRVTVNADERMGHFSNVVTLNGGELRNSATINITGPDQRDYVLGSNGGTYNVAGFLHVRGGISGTGELTKTGTGTLAFYNETNNTYSGGTRILEGTVRINDDSNLGPTSGGVILDGGALTAQSDPQLHADRTVTIESGGGTMGGTFFNVNGVVAGSGLLTIDSTSTFSLNNANNSHTGGIHVTNGILRIRQGDAALGGAANSITLDDGTTFRVQNFGSVTSAGEVLNSSRTFTLNSGTINFFAATPTPIDSTITGAGALRVNGTDVLVLSAANTYTGGTVVDNGSLLVMNASGSATGTGTVTVNSGALLGGNGTISGATTIASGATLSPGNSTGVLTFSDDLTLGGTAVMQIQGTNRGASYDGVDVGGTLTYGGDLEISLESAIGISTLNLFNFTSSSSGSFSSVEVTGSIASVSLTNSGGVWTGADGAYSFSFDQSTGDLNVIPEPGVAAFIVGLLALVFVRRRLQAKD